MGSNLVPVTDEQLLRSIGCYLTPKTLRKKHYLGEIPEIFIKMNRRLFVDVEEWNKILNNALEERSKRVKRIQKINSKYLI